MRTFIPFPTYLSQVFLHGSRHYFYICLHSPFGYLNVPYIIFHPRHFIYLLGQGRKKTEFQMKVLRENKDHEGEVPMRNSRENTVYLHILYESILLVRKRGWWKIGDIYQGSVNHDLRNPHPQENAKTNTTTWKSHRITTHFQCCHMNFHYPSLNFHFAPTSNDAIFSATHRGGGGVGNPRRMRPNLSNLHRNHTTSVQHRLGLWERFNVRKFTIKV